MTGDTFSSDFPTTSGALDTSANGCSDAFVTKLTPDGSALVYSTYLGGSGDDAPSATAGGIAVDSAGNAFVTGLTDSSDFPTTAAAYDRSAKGSRAAFVAKFTFDVSSPTPSQAVNNLIAQVNAANIFVGVASPLNATLTAAAAAFDRGQTNAAINQLRAFQNQVRAQSGKAIPTQTANALIAAAQTIINAATGG